MKNRPLRHSPDEDDIIRNVQYFNYAQAKKMIYFATTCFY
ncbi:hypothetical protein AEYBE204_08875 [Asticcacaulis sp. YBE204]|nr:hypothetical protein AEYBE204_08875 [Asticcacaulis sp. YBE204]